MGTESKETRLKKGPLYCKYLKISHGIVRENLDQNQESFKLMIISLTSMSLMYEFAIPFLREN